MKKISLFVLACAGLVININAASTNFAARVISYDPGVGFAAGFTNPVAALGAPAAVNPYGEPTDPFDPPYGKDQIVSLGAGGSLTVKFDDDVENKKKNPFGVDFIIFGNTGFIITNDYDFTTFDWIGVPATDGSLFANNTGETRVSVSRDGKRFYALDPAPVADGIFPTDGVGDPRVPVNPAFAATDFAGQTLDGIRALYAGSAGGTGYDIATAHDAKGKRVQFSSIKYVRIEVLSGKAEIDALCAVKRAAKDD